MSISAQEIIELVEAIEPQYREACRILEMQLDMEMMLRHAIWVAQHGNARRLVKFWKQAERRSSFFRKGFCDE